MANSIRFAKAGDPLKKYVQRDPQKRVDACFETYAHLILFAAAWGCKNNKYTEDDYAFKRQAPEPIELSIFKGNNLYKYLLSITISHAGVDGVKRSDEGSQNVSQDKLIKTIEGYSLGGFELLSKIEAQYGGNFFVELVEKLTE